MHQRFPFAAPLLACALLVSLPSQTLAIDSRALHGPATDLASHAALLKVLSSEHRSPVNRARDADRHPLETLEFFGVNRGMTVLEVWPGAGGWYTEILAPLLNDKGHYIAAVWPADPNNAYVREGLKNFSAKLASNPKLYGKAKVTSLGYPSALHPVRPGSVDVVVTFRNLHNWLGQDDAAPAMLKAMYDALKPGGILGVVDHRADPKSPVDPRARLGYVNESFAIELIKSAGFEFVASSEISANPKDTHDYDQGVWTLPPTYRLGDKDRARYTEIGESDRFTLKFQKPINR
jgi:predicted methyltransferase